MGRTPLRRARFEAEHGFFPRPALATPGKDDLGAGDGHHAEETVGIDRAQPLRPRDRPAQEPAAALTQPGQGRTRAARVFRRACQLEESH